MFKYEEYRNHTETDLKKHYAYEFFFRSSYLSGADVKWFQSWCEIR